MADTNGNVDSKSVIDVDAALKALSTPADVNALRARIAELEAAASKKEKPTRPFIKKGKATAGHAAALRSLGYTVEEDEENVYVEATFYPGKELPVEKIGEVVKAHQVLSYRTKVVIDGKKFFSIPLCGKLGALSCLVCKGTAPADEKKKPADGVPSFEDILAKWVTKK